MLKASGALPSTHVRANHPGAIDVDPQSAVRLRKLLATAIASMLRAGLAHSEETRSYWQTLARKYRESWAEGDLDGVAPVLPELLRALVSAGIDPSRNVDVRALVNDPAVRLLRGKIPLIDGDGNLLNVFGQLTRVVRQQGQRPG